FTIGDLSNQVIRIGLNYPESDFYTKDESYFFLDFSFEFFNGNLSLYNNNAPLQKNIATYQTNDVYEFQRIDEDLLFSVNGVIVETTFAARGNLIVTTLAGLTPGGEVNNFQLKRFAAGSVNFSINTMVPTLALDPIVAVPEGTQTVLVSGSTMGVANETNVSLVISGQTHTAAVTDNAFSFALPLVDGSGVALVAGTYPLTADVSNNAGTPATQATTNVIIEAAVTTQPIASISLDDTELIGGDAANVQIVFASAVSGFTGADITLTNASLTTAPTSTDNITWNAVLTPDTANLTAENSLVIGNAWTFTGGSSIAETALGFVNATNLNDENNGLRAATAGAWGTAGGFAQQTLNGDGALSFGFVAGAAADAAAIGFSQADASNNLHYNTIDGGLRFDNTGVSVVENGSVAHNIPLANVDAANDTFVIQRLGTSLIYKQNGTTFYSGTTATGELQVHAAFLNSSAQIRDLQLTGVLQTRFEPYAINTLVPSITLNAISDDNNITSDEDDSGIVLSGTTNMAEDGATIAAIWNGVEYTNTVVNDTWWIQIPPADVAALPAGNSTVSVSVTTGSGASANATQVVSHDLTERVVMTISDDYLESGETAQVGITFASAVENFTVADLSVENASLSAFTGSGTTWSATLTPETNNFSGNNKVRLGTEWNNTGDPVTEQGRLLGSSNAVGVLVDGVNLTKYSTSSGWNAGNFSVRSLAADGSISFGSSDPANTSAYIGFTNDVGDQFSSVQTAIDYAFYLNNGSVSVVENNSTKAANVTTITTGDRLRIERIGAGVRYYKNSTLLYTSLTASVGTLYVDTSFNAPGSVLSDIYLREFGFAATAEYAVNTAGTTPMLGMNAVAGDDVIDNVEDDQMLVVSGTATNVTDGTALSLTVNSVSYPTTVNANAWSATISSTAVSNLPASGAFVAQVTINGSPYIANRTVTRDTNRPAINFIGGATSFTDPSATTQVEILFREAVTGLAAGDFSVENGTLGNLSTSDAGISWTADFTPNTGVNDPLNSITLNNGYTVSSAAYEVSTLLSVDTFSLSGNVITLGFDQSLDAGVVLPSGSLEILVDGASLYLTDTTISGNQLMVTYSGSIGNTSLASFRHTAIGGPGISDASGRTLGSSVVTFANGQTIFQTAPIATVYTFGSNLAEFFNYDNGQYLNAGGGDDTIRFGNRRASTIPYTMTGGSGSDTFIKNTLSTTSNPANSGLGNYAITDFTTGAAGDIINVSNAINYDSTAGDSIADFIELTSDGTNTLLRFAHPGASISSDERFTSSLLLEGVTGVTLTQLISGSNLIVE
ncbi:Ig-like domain-containing protein, partial [Flavobacteriaceae bacterium]|nr:Ig-like domain-containing protein [Flavobacteriaceae bacterium]